MRDVEERDSDVEFGGTLSDGRDRGPRPRTFAPSEPDAAEARAFHAQKHRLLEQMFGVPPEEPEHGPLLADLGHYVVLGELGDGGMGRVYEAYDRNLDRKVAIKTLLELDDDPRLHARLVREAKAMAKLTHPNVVRVYEIGEAEAGPYIVMEFIEGRTLREWLGERARSLAEILEVFRAVGRGLTAIHAAGLVHRDVKPDNIMIDEDGRALVMDLGVVHGGVDPLLPEHTHTSGELELRTRTGAMIGTPDYMAPEQFDSLPITDRVDQYSFCVSLWEAIYGERPVRGASLTELAAAVRGGQRSAPKPSQAPAWLRAVLERGLATDANARFESMQQLVDALAEPQRGWAILASVTLGVAALAVAAVGLQRWYEERAPRLLAGTVDSYEFALLPGGRGIVYTKDGALWYRELDSDDARKLHDGAYAIMLARDVGRDGSVFFQVIDRDFSRELYRLRDVDAEPTRLSGFSGGFVCPLVGHDMIVTAWQPNKTIRLHALADNEITKLRDVELDGEFTWITGLACDDVNGRVAVLTQHNDVHELHVVDVTGRAGEQRLVIKDSLVHSPQFGDDGDELFYLINRGRGFELESRRLEPGAQSTSTWSPSGGNEFRSFALAPDGRIAYTSRARPRTTLRLLPSASVDDGRVALADASWVYEIPAEVDSLVLAPDERALAWIEQGEGDFDTLSLLDCPTGLGSGLEPRSLWAARGLRAIAWSPDASQLAYLAEAEGSIRIWSIGVDGDLSAMLSTSAASESKRLTWLPSGELLFHALGNRNYVVFDPVTKVERELIDNDDVGWLFDPVPAHHGREVAVDWNRADLGLWAIDVTSGDQRLISGNHNLWPLAWSADDAYIFALTSDRPKTIVRVSAAGGEPEVWRTIEFGEHEHTNCHIIFANGDLLCQTTEWDEHLWLANSPRAVSLELFEDED